ncbi:hypothetical protein KAW65_00105 [candidate division WOR-3 bacterium]|nr:hypothetical protein [candidate division WOR-3 bacterium]
MEDWEEIMKGRGKLILKYNNKEESYNADFEIEQLFNGQTRLFVKPEGFTGHQFLLEKICKAQRAPPHDFKITLSGEFENGFKMDVDVTQDGFRCQASGEGLSFFPDEIEVVRDLPFNIGTAVQYMYDLVNGFLGVHPADIEINSYLFRFLPYLTPSGQENTLHDFSVNLFSRVNTYIIFEKWGKEEELRHFVDEILILLRLAWGSNVEWVREIKFYDEEPVEITFRNIIPERPPDLFHPIIEYSPGYLEESYKKFSEMQEKDRKQFLLALHYFLKSKSEIKIENKLINALIALEILSRTESCGQRESGFPVKCLKELLGNLGIPYEFPGLKEIGRIARVRGELLHKGIFPSNAVNCSPQEFLFIIHTLVNEILLKKLNYSDVFHDFARRQSRKPGSKT